MNIKHSKGGSLFTEYGSYQKLPYELKPGDNVTVWYEIKPIARALKKHGLSGRVKIEGYFMTQVEDKYKAKPYMLNIDSWVAN